MNTSHKVLASAWTLLAACVLQAADPKPIARVMAVQDIVTDDPTGYATLVARINDVAKAKFGVASFHHVYLTRYDSEATHLVRTVTVADSVTTLFKHGEALDSDPSLQETRDRLRAIRKLGARVLYQAARFEGNYPGGSVYGTHIVTSDEAGYLQSLDQLRTLMDAAGLKDAKINVYRVLAGRSDHTHRVSIGVPSTERLGAMLDWLGTDPKVAAWLAGAATYRTVVSNATAREITK